MVNLEPTLMAVSNPLDWNHSLESSPDNSGFLNQKPGSQNEIKGNAMIAGTDNFFSQVKEQAKILSNDVLSYPIAATKVQPSRSASAIRGDSLLANAAPMAVAGIASAASYTGTLDTGDLSNPTRNGRLRDDYLLTNVIAGQQVQLNLNSTDFDPYLQLVDANTGTLIAYNNDTSSENRNSQLTFTAQSGIDYAVRVTSSASRATGSYSLLTTIGNVIPATSIDHQTITGVLQSSDPSNELFPGRFYDGYLLSSLAPSQRVQVNLNSSSFDTYLQLVNANTGQVIASDDDGGGGSNSKIVFTAQSGVDYIVRATTYSQNITGNYSLTVNSFASVTAQLDAADDSVNSIQTNYLQDDYRLASLIGGQQVQLNLNTSASNVSLQLLDDNTGQIITTSNGTTQLNFQAVNGIDYRVRTIGPAANSPTDYTLTSNFGSLYDETPINLNQSLNARLSSGDLNNTFRQGCYYDGYSLNNLAVGQSVEIRMNSSAFDTYLHLINVQTGQLLAADDDGGGGWNSRLVFTAQAGIDYLVLASSYSGNTIGNYTLTAI